MSDSVSMVTAQLCAAEDRAATAEAEVSRLLGDCADLSARAVAAEATVARLTAELAEARSQLAIWFNWRESVEAWHPLPHCFDCVAYLATEAGEALDAALRIKRMHDDRTNDRKRHLGRELAQVVDMAYASAIRYGIDLDTECTSWRAEVLRRKPEGEQ